MSIYNYESSDMNQSILLLKPNKDVRVGRGWRYILISTILVTIWVYFKRNKIDALCLTLDERFQSLVNNCVTICHSMTLSAILWRPKLTASNSSQDLSWSTEYTIELKKKRDAAQRLGFGVLVGMHGLQP